MELLLECVLEGQDQLGEGPVWDERLQELFRVDIEAASCTDIVPAMADKSHISWIRKLVQQFQQRMDHGSSR